MNNAALIPHRGRGKRVVALASGLVLLAALITLVWAGFHGRNVAQSAGAMTEPATQSR